MRLLSLVRDLRRRDDLVPVRQALLGDDLHAVDALRPLRGLFVG